MGLATCLRAFSWIWGRKWKSFFLLRLNGSSDIKTARSFFQLYVSDAVNNTNKEEMMKPLPAALRLTDRAAPASAAGGGEPRGGLELLEAGPVGRRAAGGGQVQLGFSRQQSRRWSTGRPLPLLEHRFYVIAVVTREEAHETLGGVSLLCGMRSIRQRGGEGGQLML